MEVMRDENSTVTERYRALYKLKETEGEEGRMGLEESLGLTKSVLLLHEICFALGQRGDEKSVEVLFKVLEDLTEDEVTRHEAAEAIGAVGEAKFIDRLKKIEEDEKTPIPVKETCSLAVDRLKLLRDHPEEFATKSIYTSVDPTPSFVGNKPPSCNETATEAEVLTELRKILLDESLPLFDRYRTMFSLRNINTPAAFAVISEGLVADGSSALFRHELAYVLGQVENTSCIPSLAESLSREQEHPMVRHEAAEALGAVGTSEVMDTIRKYAEHPEPLVAESCRVAIDMTEYWANWKPSV
eukprot:TRINITY_DN2244_c0_g1_i1.p1 TRINITY_DN2244_c0_g1~~TRINITY_DN2244_c0_g1_i1.p1  ORF type:complete len:318 (+),score=75.37 TRINITY_DN2244_c0_g1_i1:56-955(+)